GEVADFPHPVYAKGFVRNYAKLLGLDPQECVQILEREYCPDEIDEGNRDNMGISLKDLKDPSGKALASGAKPWGAMLIVLLLVIVLGGLVWYMAQSGREQRGVSAEPAPATEAAPGETDMAKEQTAPAVVAPVAVGNVEASAGVESGVQGDGGMQGATLESEAQPVSGKHLLVVKVTDKDGCWMGVFRNEGEPGDTPWRDEFTIWPGQDLRYEFTGSRTFRFGRLETVALELDGRARPASGSGVVDVVLP
ncbi:MAG: helix-turn-helix domain-containing protein, partial [Desulfovibrio sp.]